ncbi:MAG: hypothetical protein PVG63_00825 [Anaerolineales bacterium]|jgi:hypothetical protein
MDEKRWAARLEADLAAGREAAAKARWQQLPAEYKQILALGLQMESFNFSAESRAQEHILQTLLDRHANQAKNRFARAAVWLMKGLLVTAAIVLLVGIVINFSDLVNFDRPSGLNDLPGAVIGPEGAAEESCQQIIFSYTLVTRAGFEANIVSTCPDGSAKRRLTLDGLDNIMPAWSPDGSMIAFLSSRSGASQLYLMDENGQDVRQLTFDLQDIGALIWLPEGDRIALLTLVGIDDGWAWVTVDVETGDLEDIPAWTAEPSFHPFQPEAFSHDGSRLVYLSRPSDSSQPRTQIRVQNVDGSNDYALTTGDAYDMKPAWSPDDSQIAFLSDQGSPSGEYSLYVIDADGSNLQRIGSAGTSHTPGSSFAWSPDGKSFAIFDGSQLFVLDLETGERLVLFTVEGIDSISGVTWQP